MSNTIMRPAPVLSIPSVLAAICAIFSFTRGEAGGFALAIAAIVLGALGILLSLLPGKRGGIISFFSVIAGAFGIIASIFKLVM